MAKPDSKWYRLDNAGILYSALQKEEYSAIYRFSALMERDVDPAALQHAIDRCMPRFPSFAVRIRKGAFWYYLEPNTAPGPFLKEDVSDPCQPVRFKEDNGWLVRFYYYRSRISIEVFHALSDGGGAIVFFRTLLAEYLRQTGVDVPPGNGVLDLSEPPRAEELEDGEFAPMFETCESKLSGKKTALFGSYGWGDGEWMRTWEENCRDKGANLVCDSVICQETPDDEALSACRSLGEALA